MNSVTTIIIPDLLYNQRTIKTIVERHLEEIYPIMSYIDITHLIKNQSRGYHELISIIFKA